MIRIFEFHSGLVLDGCVITLSKGDCFRFDGVNYEVLWPPKESFPFDEVLKKQIGALEFQLTQAMWSRPDQRALFFEIKKRFLALYLQCCECCSVRAIRVNRKTVLERLCAALNELVNISANIIDSKTLIQIEDAMMHETAARMYSDSMNSTSIVFQNIRCKTADQQDILMTGDCPSGIMNRIGSSLYDSYYVLKAPHHGTDSGYSPVFNDISFSHVLISNGDYHSGGNISQKYIDMNQSLIHCTNYNACAWYKASGSCCNRLTCCYDQPQRGQLALRCPGVKGGHTSCGIRTVYGTNEIGCFCD